MRKKSQKIDPLQKYEDDEGMESYDNNSIGIEVDHHIVNPTLEDDEYPDYNSPSSGHIDVDVDVDVKEALRSSICLKSKLQRALNRKETNMDHKLIYEDEEEDEDVDGMDDDKSSSLDLVLQIKKEKKNKKPEDIETAAMRRERNRLAAQRCRQRRRDRIDKLEKICDKLQNEGGKLQTEISDLQNEMNHLQKLLTSHKCMALTSRVKRENFSYDAKYDTRIMS